MLKREWGMQSNCTYSIPGKIAALVPEFAVEDLPSGMGSLPGDVGEVPVT